MREVARGKGFRSANARDIALWGGANILLDERFSREPGLRSALAALRRLSQRASSLCTPAYSTRPMGKDSECYYADQGCNFRCLDQRFPTSPGEAARIAGADLVQDTRRDAVADGVDAALVPILTA